MIVEDSGKVKNKSKKKKKRILKKNEVVTSEDELKLRTEAMINKEKDPHVDNRGRKSLGERFRAKFHDAVYGKEKVDFNKKEAPKDEKPQRPSLEQLIEKEKEGEKQAN